MNPSELLAVYDREVRGSFSRRLPSTWSGSSDGPLTRCLTGSGGFVLSASSMREDSDAQIDALVARTVDFYRDHAGSVAAVEWKTFAHDDPRVITALARAGFTPGVPEALVLGEVGALTGPEPSVAGITVRTADLADLPAVAALEADVWGSSWDWFVPDMTARMTAGDPAHVVLAEDHGEVVAAAWLVPMPGTPCAGLWGGSTLAGHRGRGIYRALVRARANEAARRGYRLLQVDASPDSRPILERLGMTVVSATTPYWWRPAGQ